MIKKIGYFWTTSLLSIGMLYSTFSFGQQMLPANVEAGQLYDAMAQTAGEFDSMNLNYIHSLAMQQKAWNDPLSHMGEGQLKPGYSRYNWAPDTVLPVRLREGMMTLINLPTWELIEKVHLGSPEAFTGEIPAPNSLLLYADPSFIGSDSNMVVFGRSGNRYVFYLRSETYNTDKITQSVVDLLVPQKFTPASVGGKLNQAEGASTMASMSNLNKTVPSWSNQGVSSGQNPQLGLTTASSGPKDWLQTVPINPEEFKFDIEMYLPNPEDLDIAPERVWRDNIFTYIDFGPKALTMNQRPIVNLLVQDTEVPVGFRSRGKNSRLMVVEAVGDMVLRNGKKIICLKLRRDPAMGLDKVEYAENITPWTTSNSGAYQPVMGYASDNSQASSNLGINQLSSLAVPQIVSGSTIPATVMNSPKANAGILEVVNQITPPQGSPSLPVPSLNTESISLELGSNTDIVALEKMWDTLLNKYTDILKGYEPYYSLDTTADGDVRELFRLRIGPIKNLETGDALCLKLAKKGVSCSVVRVQ